ncbi:MAG: hypothetical protein U0793_05795 [Gemmataceae bacterium]
MAPYARGLLVLALIAGPSQADVVVTPVGGGFQLNFNLSVSATSTTSVQQYIDSILGPGKVTVTGAFWGNGYNGEGHVVGPTLGSDGGNFLITDQNAGDHAKITMTFAQPISSIRFDYEIFPDVTGNPDFTFNAFLGGTMVDSFTKLGEFPAGQNFDRQLLSSAFVMFPNGADKVEFVDWPATVGVDNLDVNANAIPEPASVMLLLSVTITASLCLRRRKTLRAALGTAG